MTDPAAPGLACVVYKGGRKPDTYLFVTQDDGLAPVPDALLEQLGELSEVMELMLTVDRKLARVKAAAVLEALHRDGYFLQVPPPKEILMGNDLLPR